MTGLYFFKRLIVIDVLWSIIKINNDFSVAIRKKPIDRMTRMITLVINEAIDEVIEGKFRMVSFKNHQGSWLKHQYYHPAKQCTPEISGG